MKNIYFDMDGTIADLYGVENWLPMLVAKDTTPYAQATPMVNMNRLNELLKEVKARGYTINVISWLSKNSNKDYDNRVTKVKELWLEKNVKVKFDEIHILPYGTDKNSVARNGILFDDEEGNIINWKHGRAVNVKGNNNVIFEVLESLL